MNHYCEVNEIIACITVSLFATEICTDITNEAGGKALSLQNSLPQFFFHIQATLICHVISR